MKVSMIVWYVRVAVSASMVVKSGRISVGQKQMDRLSLVIRFTRLFWLTLRQRKTERDLDGMLYKINNQLNIACKNF